MHLLSFSLQESLSALLAVVNDAMDDPEPARLEPSESFDFSAAMDLLGDEEEEGAIPGPAGARRGRPPGRKQFDYTLANFEEYAEQAQLEAPDRLPWWALVLGPANDKCYKRFVALINTEGSRALRKYRETEGVGANRKFARDGLMRMANKEKDRKAGR